MKIMNLDDWLSDIYEEPTLTEVWNAAVDATIEALLEEGNIDESYREEWTTTANKVKNR